MSQQHYRKANRAAKGGYDYSKNPIKGGEVNPDWTTKNNAKSAALTTRNTKLAAKNAGFADKLDDLLTGQIGIAYALNDPTAPARVIRNYEKENKGSSLEVVGLIFEGKLFNADKYKEISICLD